MSTAAALAVAGVAVLVVPPAPPAQAAESLPPPCAQPTHPAQVEVAECLYSSGFGSISGTAWTATDPPSPHGIIVSSSTPWCTSSSQTDDRCTTAASIRYIDVVQSRFPSQQSVFYQPALPNETDAWEKLAVCGITPESLPRENHGLARCYMVGTGAVALTEPTQVYVTGDVTVQGVPEGSSSAGWESNCRSVSFEERYCDNTQLFSAVGTVSPSDTDFDPTAAFEFAVGDDREVTFTNLSTDPEDSPAELAYEWDFDDDETSTEEDPVHTYEDPGTYAVTLQVTDTGGNTDSVTQNVPVGDPGLVVNSTGDDAAEDPTVACDTGGTIDDDPECTLRAAIETANERGGGEITFAIDEPGVPSIALGSVLPPVTSSTVIDGTTQAAPSESGDGAAEDGDGFVEVDGGSGLAAGIRLEGGSSRVTGLVLTEVLDGVSISGGTDHVVEGNRFAVDSEGTTANGVTARGVFSEAPNTEVRDNVMRCLACVVLAAGSDGSVVAENGFGIGPGDAVVGAVGTGVAVFEAQATVEDNVVRPADVGVLVQGEGAGGTVVRANRVGVGVGGGGFTSVGEGVRVDGAPDVEVLDNVLTGQSRGGVLVSGSIQTDPDEDGLILHPPSLDPLPGPVTGGGTVVRGNTIGLLADGATPSGNVAPFGVVAWAGADGLTIESNTIANQSLTGVTLLGGSGHTLAGNHLGVDATGATPIAQPAGVQAYGTTGLTVGTPALANVVRATQTSISLSGSTEGATVSTNDLGGAVVGIESITGPDAEEDVAVTDLTITGNTVDATETAVSLAAPSTDAMVSGNEIQGGDEFGVWVGPVATGTEVEGNTILRADRGISNAGAETTITDNRVGVDDGGEVDGGEGSGILLLTDSTVEGNEVAGYGTGAVGTGGIVVDEDLNAQLTGNAIYDVEGLPITSPSGPATPTITGALQTSQAGETDRTLVLVDGLPFEETGTVEVFAGADCADPEARHVLDRTVAKPPGQDFLIVPLIDRGDRDHFTVTFTTDEQGTSELSDCAERDTDPPDGDGDGAPDPVEDLIGVPDDDTSAAVITDTGDLLAVQTTDGALRAVRAVDDPAIGAHPAGFSLPYGTVSFEVHGVGQGGEADVRIVEIDDVPNGSDYWKYGEQEPDAAPGWYRFSPDAATGTGANRVAADLGPEGIFPAWELHLVDGERGDAGLFVDGVIRDPGGSGVVEQAFSDVPGSHPFFDDVGWMAAEGISTGYADGTYKPAAVVTRQAMSAFMYRLAGEPAFDAPATASFPDVPTDHPFFAEIEWMAHEAITGGYGDGTFKPAAAVTRQAMSAFMYRLAGEPAFEPPGAASFPDVPTDHPFFAEIEWMAHEAITGGYGDGTFKPAAAVTRQAMSAFMFRLAAGPGVGT